MNHLVSLFQYIRWLSLDIALGGAILVSFVGERFQLEVGFNIQSAIFLSIWIIYTVDHLRDADRLLNPSMGRHQFHKEYFSAIRILLVFLAIAGIVNLFFLPQRVILYGSAAVVIVLIYFILQKRLLSWGAKELIIAIVYSLSIFLYPLSLVEFDGYNWLMVVELIVLAGSNLLLISMIEWEYDQMDHTDSIISSLSVSGVKILVIAQLSLLVLVSVWLIWVDYDVYQVFVLLAASVLMVIALFPERLQKNERYRWLSDAIFILPVLL